MTTSYPAAVALGIVLSVTSAPAAVLLSTDFAGRTVSGKTASTITWSTNGVQDPGDLTWMLEGGGPTNTNLFDTANAQGHFAPDLNVGNEGPWSVDIRLALDGATASITLDNVILDWQHFNNAGAFQSVNRSVDWTVTVSGLASGPLGFVTSANVTGSSGTETLIFGAPLVLPSSDTYVLNINATGTNTIGNNTGLAGLTVNGTTTPVPEPSAVFLGGLGLVGLLGRRRRTPG